MERSNVRDFQNFLFPIFFWVRIASLCYVLRKWQSLSFPVQSQDWSSSSHIWYHLPSFLVIPQLIPCLCLKENTKFVKYVEYIFHMCFRKTTITDKLVFGGDVFLTEIRSGADLDHVTYGLWRTKILPIAAKSLKIVEVLVLIQIWRTRKSFLNPPLSDYELWQEITVVTYLWTCILDILFHRYRVNLFIFHAMQLN